MATRPSIRGRWEGLLVGLLAVCGSLALESVEAGILRNKLQSGRRRQVLVEAKGAVAFMVPASLPDDDVEHDMAFLQMRDISNDSSARTTHNHQHHRVTLPLPLPSISLTQENSTAKQPAASPQTGCFEPPLLPHAHYNRTALQGEKDAPGSVLAYRCEEGYLLKGVAEIRCKGRGKWTDNPPECVPVTCDAPPVLRNTKASLLNSTVTGERVPVPHEGGLPPSSTFSYTVGMQVAYECVQGYRSDNPITAVCTKEGIFEYDENEECVHISCPNPDTNKHPHRRRTGNSYYVGDVVTFSCDEGTLNGPSKITCESSGMWSSDPTEITCTAISCGAIDLNATRGRHLSLQQISPFSSEGGFFWTKGSTIEMRCEDGWQFPEEVASSVVQTRCLANGTWSTGDPPPCSPEPNTHYRIRVKRSYGSEGLKAEDAKVWTVYEMEFYSDAHCHPDSRLALSIKDITAAGYTPDHPPQHAVDGSLSTAWHYNVTAHSNDTIVSKTENWAASLNPIEGPWLALQVNKAAAIHCFVVRQGPADHRHVGGREGIPPQSLELDRWNGSAYVPVINTRLGVSTDPSAAPNTLIETNYTSNELARTLLGATHFNDVLEEEAESSPVLDHPHAARVEVFTCGPITPPLHGRLLGEDGGWAPGSKIRFVCDDGYTLKGPEITVCGNEHDPSDVSRMEYTHPIPPECEPVVCDVAEIVKPKDQWHLHRHIHLPSHKQGEPGVGGEMGLVAGTKVIWECDEGFTLVGEAIMQCQIDGSYRRADAGPPIGAVPRCQRATCGPYPWPTIPHGSVMSDTSGADPTATNAKDFTLRGPHSATCLSNGTWSNPPPKCVGWVTTSWSRCSRNCGPGKRHRTVTCGAPTEYHCDDVKKPSNTTDCWEIAGCDANSRAVLSFDVYITGHGQCRLQYEQQVLKEWMARELRLQNGAEDIEVIKDHCDKTADEGGEGEREVYRMAMSARTFGELKEDVVGRLSDMSRMPTDTKDSFSVVLRDAHVRDGPPPADKPNAANLLTVVNENEYVQVNQNSIQELGECPLPNPPQADRCWISRLDGTVNATTCQSSAYALEEEHVMAGCEAGYTPRVFESYCLHSGLYTRPAACAEVPVLLAVTLHVTLGVEYGSLCETLMLHSRRLKKQLAA
ncbi:unnamed protein product [Vitrella brassicaformis CCMP3155]|uniref:Sushi domain-containing protein n=1 Tax=Vitrella brassicaformis (strain CCMP3155) TaxID=1169540 RepID=A0A0G4ECY5_VITBC|nr:unnamed protein product [Vitrella brassicaformis CCMP3155]|eukprot:CEL93854.1 unnamed protein product [Vitrella brassicaformis CCMP3155]